MRLPVQQTELCLSGLHCALCRDRENGRRMRELLALAVLLPPGAPDFDCPLGHPWGRRPAAAPLPGTPAAGRAVRMTPGATLKPGELERRAACCRGCDEFSGEHCELAWPNGICKDRWLAWLQSPASECPLQFWEGNTGRKAGSAR